VNVKQIHGRLQTLGDPQRAKDLQRFFKTGPGEYGEGDVFLGIRVPEIRKLAREYRTLTLPETVHLLQSSIHEARLLALVILVHAYLHGDVSLRQRIYDSYLQNTRFINSWDLVDLSAEHIVGRHLRDTSKAPLRILALSDVIWERRIAVISTFHYIKLRDFSESLHIAGLMLKDPEDLIHKAVGWMLREIGKRDRAVEEEFLKKHCRSMPRTMLRYAIEKFPEDQRRRYLKGQV
jgi:3-methyladenine DNA glycosylase AlkD